MNPYSSTLSTSTVARSPSLRRFRTYVDAALIGSGLSLIAPFCNSIYCKTVLGMPWSVTLQELLSRMVPTAMFCVMIATISSWWVPAMVSEWLSRYQRSISVIVNAVLFSVYFGLLGFGYVQGTAVIVGHSVTHYVLVPAVIAGIGTWLHIVVRPWGGDEVE